MRLLAIGDVHGNNILLRKLLDRISLHANDQLVMLGDYIDRGLDSQGVIDTLLKLRDKYPQTVFLRGNHEQMLLDALYELGLLNDWTPLRAHDSSPDLSFGMDSFLFEMNGGLATLDSYSRDGCEPIGEKRDAYRMIPQDHIDFLRGTDLYYIHDDFLFVHAGVNELDPLGDECGPYDLLWQRKPNSCRIDGREMTVVHGHTPCFAPMLGEREFNLDTGAGHGRALTGCDVLTRDIWQVSPEEALPER